MPSDASSNYLVLFQDFLTGDDTLRIYDAGRLTFYSKRERLLPLMEYLASPAFQGRPVTIFDKIGGNAAALLAVRANCRELFSPLGSEIATGTFNKFGIKYHFTDIVPFIRQPDGKSMCPMEELSIDKEPEEFYQEMKNRLSPLLRVEKR